MVKAGIIGMGFIGPVHLEGLRRLGNVEVVAVADDNIEVAKAKAAMFGVPRAYADYRELLADPEVESVHICTPNYLHYEMAKAAIEAGKHIVCDKPLATTSAQAKELVALAEGKNLVAATNFNLRFYPILRQVKAMVDKGDLGDIFAVNGSFQQDWLQKITDYSWRLEPAMSGESRALADIGSHWVDSIEYVTGLRIQQTLADLATFFPVRKKPLKPVETFSGKLLSADDYEDVPIGTEDYATVLLRFDNKVHGSLTVNQAAAGRKCRMYFEIYGSKAGVWFDSERPNELNIGRRDGANEVLLRDPALVYPYARECCAYPGGHNEGYPDTFKQCYSRVYGAIEQVRAGETPEIDFPTLRDGLRELLVCETMLESGKREAWTTVRE